jgi:hypothetical protein
MYASYSRKTALKVLSSQFRSAWEWPRKGHPNPSNHPSLVGGGYMHKLQSFPQNKSPKNAGSIHFMFRGRIISRIFEEFQQPVIQTKIVLHFGWFFQKIKVSQGIERKDSVHAAWWRMRRLEAFLYLLAQNLKLSKIQD